MLMHRYHFERSLVHRYHFERSLVKGAASKGAQLLSRHRWHCWLSFCTLQFWRLSPWKGEQTPRGGEGATVPGASRNCVGTASLQRSEKAALNRKEAQTSNAADAISASF